jgi:hypothetical protein
MQPDQRHNDFVEMLNFLEIIVLIKTTKIHYYPFYTLNNVEIPKIKTII